MKSVDSWHILYLDSQQFSSNKQSKTYFKLMDNVYTVLYDG